MQRLRRGSPDSGWMVLAEGRLENSNSRNAVYECSMVALSVFVPVAKASWFVFPFSFFFNIIDYIFISIFLCGADRYRGRV